jgi:outer membrane protein TolC
LIGALGPLIPRLVSRTTIVLALAALLSTGCGSELHKENHRTLVEVERGLAPIGSEGASESAESNSELAPLDGSLERYVAHAFSHNPNLRASFEEWRGAAERSGVPRRLPDPTLTYTFFIRHVETRVGPQRHKLSLTQWFPWPTQISAAGAAGDLAAKSEQRRFEAKALELGSRVAEVYWRLWLIDRAREVTAEEKVILETFGAQVRARMEVGAADLAHLSQVNLAVSRIDDKLAGLDESQRGAAADMRRLIGAEPETAIPIGDPPPAMGIPEDIHALREAAASHPSVEAWELAAQSQDEQARSERGKRFPGLGLGAAWIETGPALDPMMAQSGKDPVMVSASLRIPLGLRSVGAAERAAKAKAAAHRARRAAARQTAVADVDKMLAQLRDAERRAKLATTTLVPLAETSYESVIGSYQAGRSSLASVLLAEKDLIQLRHDLHRAQADFGTHWAHLERIVGQKLGEGADR